MLLSQCTLALCSLALVTQKQAPAPALQGPSDLGTGEETDRGHDSPSGSRAVGTGTAKSQNPTQWGTKEGFPEEEMSELGLKAG